MRRVHSRRSEAVAKKKKVTRKGQSVSIPQNRAEAASLLKKLGELHTKVAAIQLELNRKLQALADEAEKNGGALVSESEATMAALERFAAENKEELLGDEARSFTLGNGTAGWREHPAKVNIRDTEKVLAAIKRLGLPFIRTVEEIDKKAMLANQETAKSIDGVSIGQAETFYVRLPGAENDLLKGFDLKVPKVG
ncbi:host-nuclease inhibitor Gam family protein [Candidatus Pacebacteria bacterium]|nr:host-nuclease inhibitor Gam family protein [Candidatus Paceibacterota bacterium]